MARRQTQAALCAKAIRKELKEKIPGIKFSVRSRNFAGGNAVDVTYDMSLCPSRIVWDVIGKYQYGHFDGMTDMYEYSNRNDSLPQAKYVQLNHKVE